MRPPRRSVAAASRMYSVLASPLKTLTRTSAIMGASAKRSRPLVVRSPLGCYARRMHDDVAAARPEFSPALRAALDALENAGLNGEVVTLASPDDTMIVLDGYFRREDLVRVLDAWRPRLRCEKGHPIVNEDPPRRTCACGARVVGVVQPV